MPHYSQRRRGSIGRLERPRPASKLSNQILIAMVALVVLVCLMTIAVNLWSSPALPDLKIRSRL